MRTSQKEDGEWEGREWPRVRGKVAGSLGLSGGPSREPGSHLAESERVWVMQWEGAL